jgi:hypothetical protein
MEDRKNKNKRWYCSVENWGFDFIGRKDTGWGWSGSH